MQPVFELTLKKFGEYFSKKNYSHHRGISWSDERSSFLE